MSKQKILMLGNLPTSDARSIGGATVLTKRIYEYLQEQGIKVDFLPARTHWRPKAQLFDYFLLPFKFLRRIKGKTHISIHASADFHLTIAPFIILLSKLCFKKITYHFVGGDFHKKYERLPLFFQYILKRTIFSSNTIFMETLEMITYFNEKNIRVEWLPNSRKPPAIEIPVKSYSKRFVFISRVTPTKGVEIIAEALRMLPEVYTVDIYGPIDKRFYTETKLNEMGLNYCGNLPAEKVVPTLTGYDVMLLPTFHQGEGYPGVIIEALSVGVPIICTDWNALKELVTNHKDGLLIPTKSPKSLANAMKSFTTDNYTAYSKNALSSFKKFNSDIVFKRILESYD